MCGLSNGTNVGDLEGHSPVAGFVQAFSNAIRGTFVWHFTPSRLTTCSRGPSVLAELLVRHARRGFRMNNKVHCVGAHPLKVL